MSQLLVSIIAFLVAISILVAVHEFGHFWVARRFGIKVLRFSIGFGWPLFRWYDKLGTEFLISAIPLGGYVSLYGEKEENIPPEERQMAMNHKPVWVRMLVLAAGPSFNLLFAVLIYWAVFLLGTTVLVPILGDVPKDSIAGLAGLKSGQEIIAVEGKPTLSWEEVALRLLSEMGEEKTVQITVQDKEHSRSETKSLDISHLSEGISDPNWLEALGLTMVDPVPALIHKILPDYPAAKSGLRVGDRILSANHQTIQSRGAIINYVQSHPDQEIQLSVLRDGQKLSIACRSGEKQSEDGKKIGFIGIEFPVLKEIPKELIRTQYYGIGEALSKAVKRTVDYSVLTLEVLKKMVMGKVSLNNVSGPISIAKYAGESVTVGFKHFLDFLGLISVSLGVLNLLPIPVLDGGHILYCVIELLTGRPLPQRVQTAGLWIGGFILIGFMFLAFYNDITRYFLN